MPNPFPSMRARAMLTVLQGKLGSSGRADPIARLVAEGRPPLTFAFHDSVSLSPGVVRDILIKQVGLSHDEALKVVK